MMNLNTMKPQFLPFALLLTLSLVSCASAQPNERAFVRCLYTYSDDSSISSVIFTPRNASFLSVLDLLIQNTRFMNPQTPKPVAIIAPKKESQIQTAIQCSRSYHIQIRVRSGGHDFEGSSYVSEVPFFVLDLFNFQSIEVDSESKTAWIGVGLSLGQVYWGISGANNRTLAFPAGFWRTVGAGGHISGGGYGPLTRQFGLAANNILDARIVDAYGRILDRKSMGEDFFWAIRGGVGSNFAVIVAYKLSLKEVPETVVGFHVNRTLEQNAVQLVYKWQQIARSLPVELTLTVQMYGIVNGAGQRTVVAQFVSVYRGPADRLHSLMTRNFPELGLRRQDYQEMQWVQAYPFLLANPVMSIRDTRAFLTNRTNEDKASFKWKVDFAQDPIPPEGLERIFNELNKLPAFAAQLGWTVFAGGFMDRIPPSEIPFPYRGKLMIMRQIVFWNANDSAAVAQSRIDWVRNLHAITGDYVPHNPRAQYPDYRDLDLGTNNLHGETSLEQARKWGIPNFNGNFDRLVRVKSLVDPENFFKNEQSFPPQPLQLYSSSDENPSVSAE